MTTDFVKNNGLMTLGSRFRRLGERMQADVQQLASSDGFDIPSGMIPLLDVVGQQGSMTIGELAAALGVSQPGVTRSVKQLVATGHLRLATGKADRRMRLVTLTPSGKKASHYIHESLGPKVASAVAGICGAGGHDLLLMLDKIEAGLIESPLHKRANTEGDNR